MHKVASLRSTYRIITSLRFASLRFAFFSFDKVSSAPVRFAPLIAGSVPVILAAGIAVKLAALAAGNVAGNLASATVPVRLAAGKLLFSSSRVPVVSGSVNVLFVLVLGAVTVGTIAIVMFVGK